jgi:hypothetical protein
MNGTITLECIGCKNGTITLECIGCKAKRNITAAEAAAMTDQPCCDKCGMPEIIVSATVKSRRSGQDLLSAIPSPDLPVPPGGQQSTPQLPTSDNHGQKLPNGDMAGCGADTEAQSQAPVVESFCASTRDGRCLEVWFETNVTEANRAWLLEAINEKALAVPSPTTAGIHVIPLPLWAAEDLLRWMRRTHSGNECLYPLGLENLMSALISDLTGKPAAAGREGQQNKVLMAIARTLRHDEPVTSQTDVANAVLEALGLKKAER